MATVYTYVNCW